MESRAARNVSLAVGIWVQRLREKAVRSWGWSSRRMVLCAVNLGLDVRGRFNRAHRHRTYRTGAAFQWPQLPTAIKIRHGRQASGAQPVDGLRKDFGSAEK